MAASPYVLDSLPGARDDGCWLLMLIVIGAPKHALSWHTLHACDADNDIIINYYHVIS